MLSSRPHSSFSSKRPAAISNLEGFSRKQVKQYQESLLHLSQMPEDSAQYLITNWRGEYGVTGVLNKKSIPLQIL